MYFNVFYNNVYMFSLYYDNVFILYVFVYLIMIATFLCISIGLYTLAPKPSTITCSLLLHRRYNHSLISFNSPLFPMMLQTLARDS